MQFGLLLVLILKAGRISSKSNTIFFVGYSRLGLIFVKSFFLNCRLSETLQIYLPNVKYSWKLIKIYLLSALIYENLEKSRSKAENTYSIQSKSDR